MITGMIAKICISFMFEGHLSTQADPWTFLG